MDQEKKLTIKGTAESGRTYVHNLEKHPINDYETLEKLMAVSSKNTLSSNDTLRSNGCE